ncbi:amino acid ABC transporter permease [Planomicrobium sp. CPCC 101110]|uniref:amino acid ABC transporter permease n=1 Tax=Planomicrobium sp. CPCC 101110 TaxID=2599619 RepID=UPI0011B3ABFD|nr:amino acid ABC transporter permease [Planomicrobium sp. CPCC 101110]TWT27115.1 amino acid ABC transporter permease [Planomicrobium sp. CPCC 101110]
MSYEWIVNILTNNWPMFLRGAGMTLLISIIGTLIGAFIGLVIGIVHTIPMPERGMKKILLKIINFVLSAYIEFFRGTPMMVQAMVIFYGSALAFGIDMDVFLAAVFIVSINTGAYMSEIVRGGIVSVDKGQFESAQAIGMNHFQTMMHVVLPQVVRNILPATGNQFVINIKDTAVLSVIGVTELFFQTRTVSGNNFRYFESFFVACVLYFIMTFAITLLLRRLERRMDGPENYSMIGGLPMQVAKPEDTENKIKI